MSFAAGQGCRSDGRRERTGSCWGGTNALRTDDRVFVEIEEFRCAAIATALCAKLGFCHVGYPVRNHWRQKLRGRVRSCAFSFPLKMTLGSINLLDGPNLKTFSTRRGQCATPSSPKIVVLIAVPVPTSGRRSQCRWRQKPRPTDSRGPPAPAGVAGRVASPPTPARALVSEWCHRRPNESPSARCGHRAPH
jgi:hypothetical protein